MEYLFTIFAIVWIALNLPAPPAGGVATAKLIVGLVGIILLVFVLLGVVPHRGL